MEILPLSDLPTLETLVALDLLGHLLVEGPLRVQHALHGRRRQTLGSQVLLLLAQARLLIGETGQRVLVLGVGANHGVDSLRILTRPRGVPPPRERLKAEGKVSSWPCSSRMPDD